jgi:ankyrin repeat protein
MLDLARLLLEKGAEVDRIDVNGQTAFMVACRDGEGGLCSAFWKIDQVNGDGDSALTQACVDNRLGMVSAGEWC